MNNAKTDFKEIISVVTYEIKDADGRGDGADSDLWIDEITPEKILDAAAMYVPLLCRFPGNDEIQAWLEECREYYSEEDIDMTIGLGSLYNHEGELALQFELAYRQEKIASDKDSDLRETKIMIHGAFDKLSDEVEHMLLHHKVLPAQISIPHHRNGKWIRLSLSMSAVRTEDPEEV